MNERRPSNSELKLQRLEEEEREAAEQHRGILVIFPRDEDEPLVRDEERQPDD